MIGPAKSTLMRAALSLLKTNELSVNLNFLKIFSKYMLTFYKKCDKMKTTKKEKTFKNRRTVQ